MTSRPGLIIAAPRSGSGKTTVSLGLTRALTRRGVAVQPFKCGPDYIDPAFLSAAAGRPAINLDSWAMRPELIGHLAGSAGADAALCLVEGVMGLFDGAGHKGQCGNGSTADLAALTGWPVILVLDIGAQAETAAAVAFGCKLYRQDIGITGVILNNVAGARHEAMVRAPLEKIGLPVLGAIPRGAALSLPERHLGLVQAEETADLDARLTEIADTISEAVSLDDVMAAARPLRLSGGLLSDTLGFVPPPGQRIALAQDRAFTFLYPHLLSGWHAAGAEILPFSPLADEAPDATSDAVWLPGGYPELNGDTLAAAANFKRGMQAAASRGVPIHGECGGYMVLGAGLEDAQGSRHEMLGLLGLETSFAKRKLHLGYRRARPLGEAGRSAELYGHEFHYASVLANPDAPFAVIFDAAGKPVADTGARRGTVTGAFFHLIDRAPTDT
ncbi:cobyrinate a,c-diamide synthase [Methyloligella sp. 2.7D]|uniref:cobyrinate a,c-diamide synthase n=1 Tax=unclassified Methyloligella TaxID=2625955 RepID=UPI00157D42B3|nr:cobyrinate a,c-diamide synthase [Methyloligella sp. GL2]QKP78185.1 cobyrinate a,c-diamide synthase [Methyloligella sp. GL2]